jgi:hypothetical protein
VQRVERTVEERVISIMKRFIIQRTVDVTGISGTGNVAEVVEFSDGSVAVHWMGAHPSTTMHLSMENVEFVHCHGGNSVIVWQDNDSQNDESYCHANEDVRVVGLDKERLEQYAHVLSNGGTLPSVVFILISQIDEPCPVCGASPTKHVAGAARSVHYCEACEHHWGFRITDKEEQ